MKENKWDNYFQEQYKSRFNKKEVQRAKRYIAGMFDAVNKCFPINKTDSILEIGCGIGGFIELLKDKNITNVSALELDVHAANFVSSVQGIKVDNSTISDYEPEGLYDRIFAFEVMEHLEDPISDIKKIYDMLKPGGYFVFSSPYPFKRSITSDKTHLFVLHPKNWERLVENSGFTVKYTKPQTGVPFLYRYSERLSIFISVYIPVLPLVSTSLIVCFKDE